MSWDLLGLRDEDLSPAERDERDRLLREDPAAREDHARGRALERALSALPPPPSGLQPAAVLARARRRPAPPRWSSLGAGLALAAGALLALNGLDAQSWRDRGATAPPGSVHLAAAAEVGPRLRPLAPGAAVDGTEWVVFRITADAEGWLLLVEEDAAGARPVWPADGRAVRVGVGDHVPGDARPLAWRSDQAPGAARYTALLCATPPAGLDPASGCAVDSLELEWSE